MLSDENGGSKKVLGLSLAEPMRGFQKSASKFVGEVCRAGILPLPTNDNCSRLTALLPGEHRRTNATNCRSGVSREFLSAPTLSFRTSIPC